MTARNRTFSLIHRPNIQRWLLATLHLAIATPYIRCSVTLQILQIGWRVASVKISQR